MIVCIVLARIHKECAMPCDQCHVLVINGVACHETGCVNRHLHPVTMEPYGVCCFECGCEFVPESRWQRTCIDCLKCIPLDEGDDE